MGKGLGLIRQRGGPGSFLHRETVAAVVNDCDRLPSKGWPREVCILLMYLELAFTDNANANGTFEEILQEVVSRIETRLQNGEW